MNNSIPYI